MTKKRIGITDGGIALPLGNNTFLMRGRLHSQGGIGIGNGGKNDIEVEDGEVVRFNKNNIQVLSDQPMLNGISPANALLAGGNFNKIFKAQQSINGNHHGSYGKDGLIKKLVGVLTGGDNKKENTDKAEPLNLEELKLRQAYAESAFDSNARSNKDAVGLFQIRENLLTDYNNAHGTNYTLEDLYDDKLNMSVRDWKMDKNLASDWAIRNNAPDSVVYAKSLGGYNMGNQNFLNHLGKAKAAGVDIYNSMDWISEKWLPKETVDYINFILRNQNNSPSRNNAAYELNKRKNSDKVEGIRKGFKEGGEESIKDIIRQKIYDNIIPIGYQFPIRRVYNALLDKGDFLYNNERPVDENGNPNYGVLNYRDDVFAQYLQIPENKRRNFEGRRKLIKSNYTPTIKKDNNTIYYTFDKKDIPWEFLIHGSNYALDGITLDPLNIGENRSNQPYFGSALGNHTIGKGFDDKGEYVSYYDEWDLSPFGIKKHNANDQSLGIGKRVHLYDRLYLDDYYGVPEEYRGTTYLPQVEVLPNDENYKNGGKINFNEDNVKNWIKNWLNGRKNQLKENAKSTTFAYENYKSLNNKGDIRDNGYDVTYKDNLLNPLYFLLGENPNDIRTENIIKSQLYNIDNVATINVGDYYKPNYGKLGVYVNPNPWNNTGHYIAYKGVPLDGVRVHELTHASHPDQQIDYITDVIYKDRDIPVNKNGRQTNRDKAKEVYSAIQQYRFENGLKPEDIIDKTYIENNKDKIKNTPYLENINEDDLINIFNNVAKNDDKNKNNNVFYAKNGGQINMKLKHKNKQDITDIVMNEILPHSTGERKKFLDGGTWSMIGNLGFNLLNGITQGIIGSVNSGRLTKMYKGLKRQSTYVPIPREHINTKVDVEPQLNLTAETEYNLRRNAMMNTANAKVARSQARIAALDRIKQDNIIYSDKFNKETALRNAEAELQTRYNIADTQNKIGDIREQNEFDLNKTIGIANAKTSAAQTWSQGIGNMLLNSGNTLMDYAQMNTELLKSNNPKAYEYLKSIGWIK